MPFLQPETVVQVFDITPGMRVADFGAGSGHWAVVLARVVGNAGRVYAFDIQELALEAIRSRAGREHLATVEAIRADLETTRSTGLRDNTVDFVLLSTILFQTEDRTAVLAEAWRILKPGARAAIIEWDSSAGRSPALGATLSRQDAETLIAQAGFRLEKEFDAGSHHYGLLCKKTA